MDSRAASTIDAADAADARPPSNQVPQPQQCANCGTYGHMYRNCNQPISSFGVICFRMVAGTPEYLLVQRKDSLCFVEFVRGKYSLQNRTYILRLLSNMTPQEREALSTRTFEELWFGFWQSDHSCTFMKEYQQSKTRYMALRAGYWLRPVGGVGPEPLLFMDLAGSLAATRSLHPQTEFGFPKGRRNINESDLRCACREFREESGLDAADVKILHGMKPFEEVFMGSNRVRYRHVYYLARYSPRDGVGLPLGEGAVLDATQRREVRSVGWYDAEGVCSRLRPENAERLQLFRRVHQLVLHQSHSQFFRGRGRGAEDAKPSLCERP